MSTKSAAAKAPKAAPAAKPVKAPADRSAAVSTTWQNPAVAAARSSRNAVVVDGVTYSSVGKAFTALGLPMNKHVNFRIALKASTGGTSEINGSVFHLVPAAAPVAAE